jgi:hypothetical protein
MGSKAPSTTCGKCIPRDTSSDFFLCLRPFLIADRNLHDNTSLEKQRMSGVRPYQKLFELLTVTPADGIAALAMVMVIFIGMRFLYGAWPWESRKTWYHTKPFVPVTAPPEQINSKAKEITAGTESDHFDRRLMVAE